jgi:hypothetical protein
VREQHIIDHDVIRAVVQAKRIKRYRLGSKADIEKSRIAKSAALSLNFPQNKVRCFI